MTTRSYIVDIWVDNDVVSQDELDTALCDALTNLQTKKGLKFNELSYDLTDMGVEAEDEAEDEAV